MVQEFKGPNGSAGERGFIAWRRAHPGGFVVNCGSRGWMLHKQTCPNLWPDDGFVCMTNNRKVCSEDRQELEQWAARQGRELLDCQNCLRMTLTTVLWLGASALFKQWRSARGKRRSLKHDSPQ